MSEKKTDKPVAAAALYYDGETEPVLTAKGHHEVAEQIIALAREHGVPMHQDEELTALLTRLDLGESIPKNLYIAVAKVIAFAYMLKDKTPDNSNKK